MHRAKMIEDDQKDVDLGKKLPAPKIDAAELELDLDLDDDGPVEASLRVIEDEPELKEVQEEPEEEKEVLRLDKSSAPAADPAKKVEARKDRDFLNTMLAETAEDFIDPEDQDAQWIREAAASKVRAVPFGWFILLILVFGGVLLWAGIQMWSSGDQSSGRNLKDQASERIVSAELSDFINPAAEDFQRKEAEERYLKMERAVNDYLRAELLEEKLKYVRHRERVTPLMKDYYSRREIAVREYESISEYHIVSLDNHPFVAIRVELQDDDSVALLLEEKGDEFKIDWESEVAYQHIPLEDFRKNRPDEAIDFRFYVKPDRFYAYEFRDEEQWRCYKLTARDSDEHFFGYVRRGSLLEEEMDKVTGYDSRKATKLVPLILRVTFPPAGRGERSVEIKKIVSSRWAYSTNPTNIEKD